MKNRGEEKETEKERKKRIEKWKARREEEEVQEKEEKRTCLRRLSTEEEGHPRRREVEVKAEPGWRPLPLYSTPKEPLFTKMESPH